MNERQAGNALVGAWRLLSWENRAADGQVTYPMGTDVVGYLLYTADGRFSVLISRAGRAGFAVGDLLSGTTEEKARAVEGFVAYGGRYSFHGDRVVHHVELSLFPNWAGGDQERSVELTGDRLTLSARPLLLAGKQQVPRLVWERVDPSPGAAA
jgi:Lipocalin-like domain